MHDIEHLQYMTRIWWGVHSMKVKPMMRRTQDSVNDLWLSGYCLWMNESDAALNMFTALIGRSKTTAGLNWSKQSGIMPERPPYHSTFFRGKERYIWISVMIFASKNLLLRYWTERIFHRLGNKVIFQDYTFSMLP